MNTAEYQRALCEVRSRVVRSRSSFNAGMAVLPREKREAMYALYAFCREVDDIADDGPTPEERRNGLRKWRELIRAMFREGRAEDDITRVLSVAVKKFDLAEEDFQAVIDGMAMDAGEPIRAPSLTELDIYCDRVASAVGRVSVRIFGDAGPSGFKVAHHLGRALQLTNILRDLVEDAARGRLYLPRELLEKYSITARDPREVLRHESLPLVCRDLAAIAESHFAAADAAMRLCNRKVMRPARVMHAFYGAVLEKLIAEDWYDPSRRVCLPAWRKLWLALKSFL